MRMQSVNPHMKEEGHIIDRTRHARTKKSTWVRGKIPHLTGAHYWEAFHDTHTKFLLS